MKKVIEERKKIFFGQLDLYEVSLSLLSFIVGVGIAVKYLV